ncbi:tetratricopeptide repeat protein [Massilia sp. S19_KUP03_FR1]|uniref:tetratricopeptide repeat protein n=1 Tax=Massilia sp. S19_KUP03_FR1 TaxID=3025503 RepID=UPI002FCDE1B3
MPLFYRVCLSAALACCGAGLHAAPYIPKDGKQVVEHLPSRADPVQRELRRLRTELHTTPNNVALATTLAQRYIEQARVDGDPRYLGYAQSALAPWWKLAAPPEPVLVLRATLRQSTHQFEAALLDLDQAVKRDSSNVQAWITRATVQMISGDFAAAKASCMRLYSRAPQLVIQTCLSNIANVSGDGPASYQQLATTLAAQREVTPAIRIWVTTLLAEMAARAGDSAGAEKYFREALAVDHADSYLLAAWSDYLLDHGRAPEVARLLQDKTRADALLLRYALALKAMNAPAAAEQADALRARFEAATLRGDTVHQREQARFELALRNNPSLAVKLAKLNWAVQKEPADFRILAETAAASGDLAALTLVVDWLRTSRLQDQTVAPALRRLKVIA